MPGETPDYGRLSAQATVFPVTDLGELGARLGSIVTHDRRGDVVWLDSFEEDLRKWVLGGSGVGNTVDLSRVRARNGFYSARLVAGSDGSQHANITHVQAFPAFSRMGFEFSFSYEDVLASVELQVQLYDGVNRTVYRVRWVDTDNTIVYFDSSGNVVTLATGVDLRRTVTLFHTIKLVVDASAGEYVRLILNETEYSMAGIAAQSVADSIAPNFLIQIVNNGAGASNFPLYIDDVILTQNEPA